MADPPKNETETFTLDLQSTDAYTKQVDASIKKDHALTANWIALLLVGGLLSSLPVYLIALAIAPSSADKIADTFETWYFVLSPLAGTAIGAYYASSRNQ